jgi:indolepyruvate ferredoxin oxidoreductase
MGAAGALAEAVAHGYHKLLAYKDEYEVARLFSSAAFEASLRAGFGEVGRLEYHFAPPLLARKDPLTGRPRKIRFGAWMGGALKLLARLRFLRGTWLDPFGHTEERRLERQLIDDYEALVARLLGALAPANLDAAVRLARLPERIRGFGPVKLAAIEQARAEQATLLETFARAQSPAARTASHRNDSAEAPTFVESAELG